MSVLDEAYAELHALCEKLNVDAVEMRVNKNGELRVMLRRGDGAEANFVSNQTTPEVLADYLGDGVVGILFAAACGRMDEEEEKRK